MASIKINTLILVLIFFVCFKTIKAMHNGSGSNNLPNNDDYVNYIDYDRIINYQSNYEDYIDYDGMNDSELNYNDEGTNIAAYVDAKGNTDEETIHSAHYNDDDGEMNNATESKADLNATASTSTAVVPDYENIVFNKSSPAGMCLHEIGRYCNPEVVTKRGCAKEGIRSWPKEGKVKPFVFNYFEQYRNHITAGQFQLPSEFCLVTAYYRTEIRKKFRFDEVEEMIQNSKDLKEEILQELLEKNSRCNYALIDFRGHPNTITSNINYLLPPHTDPNTLSSNLIGPLEPPKVSFDQQIRQDILLYTFFAISKKSSLSWNSYVRLYINYIADFVIVDEKMPSPTAFCLMLTGQA